MRILKVSLLVFMAVALLACARPTTQMSGIIVYGHEVRTIRLCGDSQTFWLHATQEQQQQLAAKSRKLTTYPYQELYLEFTGRMLNDAPGEFAKEYVGTVKAEQIISISVVIPDSCGRLRAVP